MADVPCELAGSKFLNAELQSPASPCCRHEPVTGFGWVVHGLILHNVPSKPGEAKNHFGCLPRDLRLPQELRPAVAASWISLGVGGQGH
jgi:hypothetical protein